MIRAGSVAETPRVMRNGGKRKVVHIANVGAIGAAMEMGIQVRYWCGVWGWPKGVGRKVEFLSDLRPESCKRCARVARSRAR